MLNLGGLEILVILVVALLVLGPEKLPGFMRTVGKALGEARRATTELQRSLSTAAAEADEKNTVPEPSAPTEQPLAAPGPSENPAPTPPPSEHRTPVRVLSRPGRNAHRTLRKLPRVTRNTGPTETP